MNYNYYFGFLLINNLQYTTSQVADPFCTKGLISGNICCSNTCSSCGGLGCSTNPVNCCLGTILQSNQYCNTTSAPCVIVDAIPIVPRVPSTPDPKCSNGTIHKNICCDKGCKSCGGLSCSTDPLGTDKCCLSAILNSNDLCSVYSAPCIIGGVTNTTNTNNTNQPSTTPSITPGVPSPTSGSISNKNVYWINNISYITLFLSVIYLGINR
jgi:hypothetical protein